MQLGRCKALVITLALFAGLQLPLSAQLSVSAAPSLSLAEHQQFYLGAHAGAMKGWRSKVPGIDPAAWSTSSVVVASSLSPAREPLFDFTQTAPHLAFFCRLEINDKVGSIIPAKFRLGGHTYWQDNLLRQ